MADCQKESCCCEIDSRSLPVYVAAFDYLTHYTRHSIFLLLQITKHCIFYYLDVSQNGF